MQNLGQLKSSDKNSLLLALALLCSVTYTHLWAPCFLSLPCGLKQLHGLWQRRLYTQGCILIWYKKFWTVAVNLGLLKTCETSSMAKQRWDFEREPLNVIPSIKVSMKPHLPIGASGNSFPHGNPKNSTSMIIFFLNNYLKINIPKDTCWGGKTFVHLDR